jgi:hypothetical protein
VPDAPPKRYGQDGAILRTYPYYDEDGELLFEVVRFDTTEQTRRFRQRRPDGAGGWIWDTKGVRRILFRLPELFEALRLGQKVLVTEGERDCLTAVALGFAATTAPGGVNKWRDEYDELFCDADVIVVADNDRPGQDHAANVAHRLCKVAARLRIITPNAKDLTAWHEAGGTQAELDELIEAAPDLATSPPEPDDTAPLLLFPSLPPQESFPVAALGPLAEGAAAIAAQVQVAECVAGSSVLAVAALVAQEIADAVLPIGSGGQLRPLSLDLATIAVTGGRKSTVDTEALRPVRFRERELRADYEVALGHWKIQHKAWLSQARSIERKTKLDFAARVEALKALGPEPRAPIHPTLLIGDLTIEGLTVKWQLLPSSLALFTTEGGRMIGGYGFNPDHLLATAASLSLLWDAGEVRRVRAGDEEIVDLHGRRLAVHLMIQPKAAFGFLGNEVIRDQGLLSRLLLAAPPSLAGVRLFKEPGNADDAAIAEYSRRILAVLNVWPKDMREAKPRPLPFSTHARGQWIEFYNHVEREQGSGRSLAEFQEVANKIPEQAARIAGVLAIVADPAATEIDGEAMRNGITLAAWYLTEATRLTGALGGNQALENAQALLDWLQREGRTEISNRDAQRLGPGRLRQKALIEAAFKVLKNHFWLKPHPTRKRRWLVVPAGAS